MKLLACALALLLQASVASAYSLLWLDVISAHAEANASADNGQSWRTDHDAVDYPGAPLPLIAQASANFSPDYGGWGSGYAEVQSNAIFVNGYGNDSEDQGNDGSGGGGGEFSRHFRVLGGSGSVEVEIPINAWGEGDYWGGGYAEGWWSVGVVGVSSVGEAFLGDFSFDHYPGYDPVSWLGNLNYGQTYTLSASAGTFAGYTSSIVSLSLPDVPGTSPVPEPGTWALVAAGLLVATSAFRRKGGES